MKYIKRKSAVKPITGSIVDTMNVDDKTTNAPSIRVFEEEMKNIDSTQILTQTISKSASATAHVVTRKVLLGTITVPDGYSYIGTLQTDYTATSSIKGIYVYTEGTSVYADINNTGAVETVTIVCTALFIKK